MGLGDEVLERQVPPAAPAAAQGVGAHGRACVWACVGVQCPQTRPPGHALGVRSGRRDPAASPGVPRGHLPSAGNQSYRICPAACSTLTRMNPATRLGSTERAQPGEAGRRMTRASTGHAGGRQGRGTRAASAGLAGGAGRPSVRPGLCPPPPPDVSLVKIVLRPHAASPRALRGVRSDRDGELNRRHGGPSRDSW